MNNWTNPFTSVGVPWLISVHLSVFYFLFLLFVLHWFLYRLFHCNKSDIYYCVAFWVLWIRLVYVIPFSLFLRNLYFANVLFIAFLKMTGTTDNSTDRKAKLLIRNKTSVALAREYVINRLKAIADLSARLPTSNANKN